MRSDTSAEAHRVHLLILRQLGAAHRGGMASALSDRVFHAALEGLARRRSELTPAQRRIILIGSLYGPHLARGVARRLGIEVPSV